MKFRGLLLAVVLLTGLPAAPVRADVLFKVKLGGSNHSHRKFPTIEERTLGSDQPVLKSEDRGDLVDLYGPCDQDPPGKDEIASQGCKPWVGIVDGKGND